MEKDFLSAEVCCHPVKRWSLSQRKVGFTGTPGSQVWGAESKYLYCGGTDWSRDIKELISSWLERNK